MELTFHFQRKGGSGLAITGEPPNLPGCQGQVTASDFADNCNNKCKPCISSHPCTECQYWPIYPCYSPKVKKFHIQSENQSYKRCIFLMGDELSNTSKFKKNP